MRRAVTQAFARPVVEPVNRLVNVLVTDSAQVGALGKVLTQQPVGVLIESTLPGVVGMCEVHIGIQAVGNEGVLGKLLAIVKCQRQALAFVGSQQFDDGLGYTGAVLGVHPLGQGVARLALHQSDQRALVAFADDRIALPVADAAFFINDGRALLDADPVLNHPTALLATGVALAAHLLAAQMTGQITAAALVLVDVLVNGFVADAKSTLQKQPTGHLLGGERQAQISLHMAPLPGANLIGIAPVTLAGTGLVVGLGGLVAAQPAVALNLACDGRYAAIELSGDARVTEPLAAQRVNLVSFFPAQVCVVHVLCFDWLVQGECILHTLDPTYFKIVALRT